MYPLFERVTNLAHGAEVLRRRKHGVVEAIAGQFHGVRLRPFPRFITVPEIVLLGRAMHEYRWADRCLLYYDQPRRFPNYLALKYIVTTKGTSLQTFYRALDAFDQIARIKGSDALLCEVANLRLSPRLMQRWGWESHCPSRWHKHYIKRFYGNYPPPPRWLQEACDTKDRSKLLLV